MSMYCQTPLELHLLHAFREARRGAHAKRADALAVADWHKADGLLVLSRPALSWVSSLVLRIALAGPFGSTRARQPVAVL